MKALLIFGLMALLSSCISTEHSSDRTNVGSAGNSDGLVCKTEKPTGSHRSIRICRTVAEVDSDKKEAEEGTRRIRDKTQINSG